MTTSKWDIVPGELDGTRKSLIISLIFSVIIMVFIFTVFPMLKVKGTRPSLPASFEEVLVDIVKAKEREQPQEEQQQEEEEQEPEEEAPQRRTLEERRTTPRERQRETRTRPETQDLALQQEIDLNLQRQRSQRSQRRDRDMGQRQSRDRASTSDIIVPRGDASLTATDAPRASIGRSDRSGRSSRRADRGARSASLELGEGPAVDVQYEPDTGGDVEQDASAVIEWMRSNGSSVPRDLLEPEYFNYQAGDLTSKSTFVGPDGKEYTLYLLGRDGDPPELKIFLVQGRSGVLVTDIGAQGARSESLQAGQVLVRGDRMSLQMSQISPGDPRADQAMEVFQAWWDSL